MKKLVVIVVFFVCSTLSFSQNNFKKGYFINDNNKKVECLIKDLDWRSNPYSIEYKIEEEGKILIADIKKVKEFSVIGNSKYIRSKVLVDRSSDNIQHLSKVRNPIFKEETIFLKVLVEGNANLYKFTDNILTRFFYKKDDLPIEQLIYKIYEPKPLETAKNERFKMQLKKDFICGAMKPDFLRYKTKELKKYFARYNHCKGDDFMVYENKNKSSNEDKFSFSLKPGILLSDFSINNSFVANNTNVTSSSFMSYRFGAEIELTLPFNNDKWGIFFEPAYVKAEATVFNHPYTGFRDTDVTLNYNRLELSLGLRHYSFLSKESRLFYNVNVINLIPLSSSISSSSSSVFDLSIDRGNYSLDFGIGYQYANYSLELRYQGRSPLAEYLTWDSKINNIGLILGVTL